jgi:hypothetical protein
MSRRSRRTGSRDRGGLALRRHRRLRGALGAVEVGERLEEQLRDPLQGVLDPHPLEGDRLEIGEVARVQPRVQRGNRERGRKIALVVLDDHGQAGVEVVRDQVAPEALEALQVRIEHRFLAVRHEDDRVRPLQHHLAGGVVEDLSRHRVHLHPRAHAADGTELDGEEVEEEGPIRLGGQGQHLALGLERDVLVDPLEIRGLAAEAGPVVDELGRDLLGGVVE